MPVNMLASWVKNLFGRDSRRSRRLRSEPMRRRAATQKWLGVESLEDRVTPTGFVVTLSTPDLATTAGTLRYALTNSVAGDTISFASSLSGATITTTSVLTLSHNITIVGLGASSLAVSGANGHEVFAVSSGVTASISGLTIENGLVASGSGIKNAGTLSLSNDSISGNGAAGNTTNHYGGGIYNSGTLDVNASTISGNFTFTDGGGIYNSGTATISNSTISGNGFYTYGGGIDNVGTMTLSNDTLSGNTGWNGTTSYGEYGGGINNSGTLQMSATLVSGNNSTTSGKAIYGAVAAVSINNLVDVAAGMTGLTNGSNGNQVGISATPNPLASNGGPTNTMSLPTGSAAIGHGGAVTTVSTAIASSGNTITLTNNAYIARTTGVAIVIQIDSEQMLVTGISGTTLTVIRGYNGTTAAAHLVGANVSLHLDQRGYAITTTTPDVGAYQSTGTAPGTPTVSNVNPNTGSTGGGTSVTITGTNLSNATAVFFGAIPGTIVSDSGTVIVATTAAEPAATVDTTVTTVGWDTSATSTADHYTFASSGPSPTVTPNTSNLPDSSTTLTINGTNFSATPASNTVVFNLGVIGTVTASTTTQLTVTISTPPTSLGALTAVVTSNGNSSGSPVQVATEVNGTWTVTSNSGTGGSLAAPTLPYAVATTLSGDTINFASGLNGSTITLASTLTISHNITITGLGATSLTVSGTSSFVDISVSSGVTASISGLTITNGLSLTGNGIRNAGTLTLTNDSVSGNGTIANTGSDQGGGIYNSGTMTISGSIISNNSTYYNGGGIENVGTLSLSNSTVSGNYAYTYGGGIYNTGTLTLSDATIAANSGWDGVTSFPELGGGLYAGGTVTMNNTIVANDTTSGTGPDVYGTIAVGNDDLIGNSSGATISSGSGNLLNPTFTGLAALGSYGGTTQTYALLPGSPAINAGSNSLAVGSTDQRGNTRVVGGTVDIGAFESQGFTLGIVSGNNQTANLNTAFTNPLVVSVTPVNSVEPVNGGQVTFTPNPSGGGASATLATSPATISSGQASVTATANSTSGSYTVTASDSSATSATFSLTNAVPPPAYSENLDGSGNLTITQAVAALNDHLSLTLSGGNYTFTDTGGLHFSPPTGAGAGSISGAGTSTITIPSSAVTSITITLGTGTNIFTFTGTNGATAAPLSVNTGATTSDQANITGAVQDSGALTLTSSTIGLNGGTITTTGNQTYNGAVTLGVNTTVNGANVTFGSTVNPGAPVFSGSVAILSASTPDGTNPNVMASIIAGSNGVLTASNVTVIDVSTVSGSTPTLAQLDSYSAVIVYSNYAYADPTTLGNNLASYVNQGHGVVTATFNNDYGFSGASLGGTWASGGYDPYAGSTVDFATDSLGTIELPSSPVMAGVTSFTDFYHMESTLTPNDTLIASYTSGYPLAAQNNGFAGTIIGLNMFPPSSTSTYGADGWTGNGGQLMANSLIYAGSTSSPSNLTVNASGTTTFGGVVGGVSALTSLTVNGSGTTAINGGGVTTSGTQTYNNAVTLGANTTLSTTLGGNITFASTVNGAYNLTVNTSGGIDGTTFSGVVGGTTALSSVTATANGTTAINGGSVTTTGAQTYNNPVTLGANTTLTSTGGGGLTFGTTVNGLFTLAVSTAGTTTFAGAVGTFTPLVSLTTAVIGTTMLSGGTITTTGNQTYNDPVTLGLSTTINGANVTFASTLNSVAASSSIAILSADTPTTGSNTDVMNNIIAGSGGVFNAGNVTVIDVSTVSGTTPTLAQLDSYGAVIVYSNYAFANPTTLGNNLASYVNQGNGVVTASFANDYGFAGDTLAGTWASNGYDPYSGSLVDFATDSLGIIEQPSNPVMAGITSFTDFYHVESSLTPNDTLIASYTSGYPLAVQNNGFAGTIIGLNMFPPSSAIYGADGWTGQGGQLMANALKYALPSARSLTVNASGATTFNGAVGGVGPLGSLTVAATGTTAINGGSVTTVGAQTYNNPVTLGASTTLTSTSSGNITFASTVNGANNLTVSTAGTTTFGGVVGGTTALTSVTVAATGSTAINGGSVTTTGAQTYNNPVTLGANTTLTSTGSGNLSFGSTVDGAVTLVTSTTGTTSFAGAVGGITPLTSLTVNTTNLTAGAIATTTGVTVNNTGTASSITGVISGATAPLTKTGTGTLTLSGTNTYGGITTVSGGVLSISSDANLGTDPITATPGDIVLNGGTLQATASFTLNSNRGTALGPTSGSGSGTIDVTSGNTLTDAGILANNGSGTGGLIKIDSGTLTLSGANTYTGATTVSGGTLQAGITSVANTSGAFGNNSAVIMANTAGATLNITGFNTQIGSLTGGGTTGGNVTLGSSTLTVGGNNTSPGAYAGAISGSGSLTKIGTGTLNLTGASTYTGPTTVSAGTLAVNGSITSSVTNSGTLQGSGTITGNVSGSGTFSPGNNPTPGIMTINGNFTPSGTVTFKVNTPYVTAGTDYDQYVVSGTVNLTGSTLTLTNNLAGTFPPLPALLTLISHAAGGGLTTGGSPADGSSLSLGSNTVKLFYNGNDGNDVVIVNGTTPTIGYISNTFAGDTNGTLITDADLGTAGNQPAIYGVNAFTTIGAALGGITSSGQAIVNSGTYAEAVNVTGTQTLTITGVNVPGAVTINSLTTVSGTAVQILGSSSLTDGNATSTTVAGVISGSGSLTKIGTGTLTLTGTNTYSGPTTISSGVLSISSDANLGTDPITATAGDIVLNGGTLQATASFTLNSNRGTALGPTTGSGSGTIDVTGSNTLTDAGVLANNGSDTGGLIKIDSGTLTLSGANTYTGATTVNGGTLQAGITSVANTSGAFGDNSAVIMANTAGATLNITGFNTQIGSLTGGGTTGGNVVLGSATLMVGGDNTSPAGYAGVISGSGSLTKIGTGTLTLTGADTYTGATTVSAGTLAVNGSITSSVTNSGTLQGSGTITGNVSGTGTFSPGNNPTPGIMTINGNFTPSGTLVFKVNTPFATAGTDYDQYVVSGTVNLTGSTLTLTNNLAGTFPPLPALLTLISHAAGGGLTTGGSPADGSSLSLGSNTVKLFYNGNDGNDVVIVNGTTPTIGYISNTFTGDTNGTLITDADLGTAGNQPAIYGVNAFSTIGAALGGITSSGQAIVNSGTYAEAVNLTGTQTLTITGVNVPGAVTINSLTTVSGTTVQIQGSSSLTDGNATSTTVAGVISGSGSLTKIGTGTLTLSGVNTYSGTTTISSGVLSISSDANLGADPTTPTAGDIVLNGGTLQATASFTLNSNRGTALGPTTGSGSGTIDVTGSNTLTDAGILANNGSDTGGLIKIDSGTLTLSGANTYTGATTVNGGTLQAGIVSVANTSGAFGDNSAVIMANTAGATLNITGFNTQIGSLTGGGTTGGNVVLGSATLMVGGDNTSPAGYAGVISGSGGVTKIGTGTLTLSGANTYSGATTVNGGTLQAGITSVANTSGAFGDNSAVIMANTAGAMLNITGFNTQIGSLTGGGTTGGNVVLGSATLMVGGDNTSPAGYAGVISGSGSLTKIGTGTLNLTGADTYTGATTVSAGTLSVNGSITSSVTNSGTLQGSGTITGNVSGTGTFSPGNNPTPGIMTINGNFTPSGSVTFKVNTPFATAGTDYDQYVVSGTVNLTGSTLTLTNNLAGTFPPLPALLTLISHAAGGGLTTGGSPADGSSLSLGSNTVKLFYNGNDGNDVVIVNGGPVTIAYVSPTFAGDTNGMLITDADLGTAGNQPAIYGVNAFTTIGATLGGITSSGQAIVNSGTYAEAVNLTGTQTLTITGVNVAGAVTINSLTTVSGTTVQILGSSSLTDGNATSTTVAGVISGSGNLTKIGTGTLTLSGADTYTGTTTVSAGTLAVNGSITSSVTNSGTLQGSGTITGNVSGTGTFSPGNNPTPGIMTINGNFTPSGTVVFKVNTPYATAGTDYDQYVVSGTVNLTGSTLTLTNNLAGTFPPLPALLTLISHAAGGGLTTGGSPADGSSLSLGSNTVKLFYNGNDGNDVVIVNGTAPTTVYVSATFAGDTNGTLIPDADFGTAGNQGAIYGVNAFTTIGAALGVISSSGQLIVNSGTYAEAVTLTGTQTLTITGVNVAGAVTINSLSTVSGTTVQIQGSSSLTDGNATSTTVAGVITGGGSLTKIGTGTLTLTGTNTYTGATTVSSGTLLVNGNDSAATGGVAVNSTGTLAGTGTLGGVVTVNSGGFISPGTVGTVGTLTVGGLNFNGGTYLADFSGNTSDTIDTSGTINLADSIQGVFSVNSQTGSTTASNVYTLIDNTGAGIISNPPFSGATEGGMVTINGMTTYATYAGGNGKSFTLTASGSPTFSGSGTLTVRKDTTDGANNIELLQGSTIIDERPLASIPSSGAYSVTATGASTLTVDYTNSPPTPAGLFPTNINFIGFGADTLTVNNGTFGKIVYNPSSTTAETIQEYTNSGDTTPVTTITATGVSTVSDTSTNTGLAIVNLPNLLPGTGSTTFGTALSGAGVTQFASTFSPTTGFGDPATNLAINFGATGSLTLGKMDSGFNPSGGVQVTGTSGNDSFTVNWIASQAVTINGNGGSDSVTVNSGKSGGAPGSTGAGDVILTGTSIYLATVTGVGNDIIDVNDQNQAATSPPPAPSGAPINGTPAITTGSGPGAVATNGVDVLNYSAANLTTLNLVETTGTNTYNIQFVSSTVAGSKLPTTATNIETSTKTDTANLFGTQYVNAGSPGIDTFDVGFTTPGTTTDNGGSPVTYPQGGASYLATLNVYGEDEPNTAGSTPAVGDTFKVFPDAYTTVNIDGGLPTNGYGNTLILNTFGLTNPQIVPLYGSTALPDGEITSSNKAIVTWNSIESFPVPLGLGGTFNFQPVGSATQQGFLPVYPSDTPTNGQYANANDGWINPGAGAYDRSEINATPNSPGLATLLETAEWGYQGGGVEDGQFQVTVAPNQTVQVSAYIGDTFGSGRDLINVYVGTPGNPYESMLNPSSTTFNTFSSTSYKYVSYSGMFNPGSSSTLVFTFDKPDGGTSEFWTVSGLDVRPVGLVAPLTLTRADSAPLSQPQAADGLTIDTYNGSGAAPFAELTVNPQYGTPVGTDIDPAVKGFQVQANATGNFTFQILRPTGSGPSLISVTDVTGVSGTGQVGPTAPGGLAVSSSPYLLPNSVYQTYTLPVVRRIDFGPLGTPGASDSDPNNPNYLVFANAAYTSTVANALGWIGTAPTPFDSGGSPNNLQRDLVYGSTSTPGDFELDMPAANTVYSVTVLLGDPVSPESGMYVDVVDPATGTIIESTPVTGVSTPAGQSSSFTFPVTTDSSGRIRLRFGTIGSFWTLQDVEVRPEVGTTSPPVGTEAALTLNGTTYTGTASGTAGSYSLTSLPTPVPADGMTSTTYTITGATPNSLITVTSTLGTLTTADAGPTYTGVQVQANGSGMATFTITSPLSASSLVGTITLTEVTGASMGVFTQGYTGVSASPPGSPPTTVQRYEFTNGSPVQPASVPFVAVSSSSVYTQTSGYGWQTAVSGYDRGAGSVPAPYLADLYRAGAWGEGSGTFEVSVPTNSDEDVRVYVGDPYNAWAGITVSVNGSTPVSVDPIADRYGYVTVSDVSDNGTGILDITINGGIWVASGVDVATTGDLPTPATGATNPIPATGTRLEFASSAISGFTSVSNTTVFTQGAQYGWSSPVGSFVRPASYFPANSPLTPTEMQIYGSGAYGSGTSELQIAVQPGATYTIRAYVSDPYNAWSGITISAEGGTTVSATATSNPPGMYTLTGQDVNGDGVLTITISGPIWVLNGIDIVQNPNTLPAAP